VDSGEPLWPSIVNVSGEFVFGSMPLGYPASARSRFAFGKAGLKLQVGVAEVRIIPEDARRKHALGENAIPRLKTSIYA
jgi:hypothetical protein